MMYAYSCLAPGEGVWPPLQPLTYTYLSGPLLLPPIQAHNFCSRPPALGAGDWMAPRQYHCFHGPGASPSPSPSPGARLPWWAFPQAYVAALRPPVPASGYPGPSLQSPAAAGTAGAEGWSPWPEGSSLDVELRWGRVERALGPRRALPDIVHRELRRVYGTYPRTAVRITFRGGEFLLRATPRVGEPEYRVHRRLLRAPAGGSGGSGGSSGSSGSGGDSPAGAAAERSGRKRRKGLG